MRRRSPRAAEIGQRLDDASPEVVIPDPVDENSRGERILWIGQPLRERESATGRAFERWRHFERCPAVGQNGRDARTDIVAGVGELAATKNPGG